MALPEKGPRRVSVDSFGVGGTNGHIILDHVSAYLEPHALANALAGHFLSSNGHTSSDPMLLVWSASQEKSLDQMVESYTTWSRGESFRSGDELRKLAYTLGRRRSMMLWRTFSVVSEGLPITDFQAAKSVRSQGRPVAALVFTGQGAQYASMGMELLRYLVFKETLKQTAAAFQRLGCDWSLFGKLQRFMRNDFDADSKHCRQDSRPRGNPRSGVQPATDYSASNLFIRALKKLRIRTCRSGRPFIGRNRCRVRSSPAMEPLHHI